MSSLRKVGQFPLAKFRGVGKPLAVCKTKVAQFWFWGGLIRSVQVQGKIAANAVACLLRAKERREAMESSPSIRERIPKLKYTSSLLPAMHTPRHLTGRGGGKKSTTLFAADYFPAHRNPGAPPTRPYRLLRPAKQAVPPPPDVAAVGSSPQAALPAGRAAAPSDLSQRVDALTLPDAPLGWAPPSPSPPVQMEYTSEEGPSTPEVFSSSSSWESEPINTG